MSVFDTFYLTLSQVCDWIVHRDPEKIRKLSRFDYYNTAISDSDIEHLRGLFAGALANSRVDALQQLLAALEASRVKATGRRYFSSNPGSLPAHYWPRLTFFNHKGPRGIETCVRFKTEQTGPFWSDLLFGTKGVLAVWPPPTGRKQTEPGAEDGSIDKRGQHHPGGMSGAARGAKRELRPAPDSMIHKAISEVYDEAEKCALKPPNVKEIVAPVQTMLLDKGYEASGRHIQELAEHRMHKSRRRKPGTTVASEKRRPHR
jgi:hypothetical protein